MPWGPAGLIPGSTLNLFFVRYVCRLERPKRQRSPSVFEVIAGLRPTVLAAQIGLFRKKSLVLDPESFLNSATPDVTKVSVTT